MENINKLADLYWNRRLRDLSPVADSGEACCCHEIVISNRHLGDFLKISGNASLAQFTILATLVHMLLPEFDQRYTGILTAHHSFDAGNPGAFFLKLNLDSNEKSVKENIKDTRLEVQEALSYGGHITKNRGLDNYSQYGIAWGTAEFRVKGLVLEFICGEREFVVRGHFRKGFIEGYVVEQFLKSLAGILQGIGSALDVKCNALDYISTEERETVINGFNNTQIDYPAETTIVDVFAAQVGKTPDHVAVVFKDVRLTYRELDVYAEQFSSYLISKYAVKGNDLVAVLLDRSEKMIIAIWGILKAGAAYVPIDPAYPAQRIEYILKDTDTKLLIDEKEFECFVAERDALQPAVVSSIVSTQLAYCIYTSGSTGNPKGVLNTHAGLYNRLLWMKDHLGITPQDNFLLKTPYTFDVSVWELTLPFITGSTLIVAEPGGHKDPVYLTNIIDQERVSVIHFVPSMLDVFLQYAHLLQCKSLAHVVCSGEALAKRIVDGFKQVFGNVNLYNFYGPTEAAIDVTAINLAKTQHENTVSIGYPVANVKIYIADGTRLKPPGAFGEILISGVQVANGYLNLPELTKERFLEDPFCPGNRIYRTGDVGRWLADGAVEYAGRKDSQVKIRGNRVELGEIEAAVKAYAAQIQQVIAAVKEVNEEQVLVGYYIVEPGLAGGIDKAGLRTWLQDRLPEYMVPGYFIELDAIPLTHNGKADYKSLPEIKSTDSIRGEYIAPADATEEKLVAIWQRVLKADSIGVKDNFFHLGGHSLMIGQVLNQVRQVLSQGISFKEFFDDPTIAGIARKLKSDAYEPIPKAPVQPSYVLSSSQRRLWILSQFEAGSIAYNMPGVFELTGELDEAAMSAAFDRLIARHEILRTVFRESTDGEVRQTILEESAFRINYHDLRHADQAAIKEKLQNSLSVVFNLADGPLLCADVYQVESAKWVFCFVMHHIISDGWSLGILIKELLQLYEVFAQGGLDVLPPLSIHYKDYAAWQQGRLTGDHFQHHKRYWLEQLSGEIPVLDLPASKIRPAVKTYSGGSVYKQLDKTAAAGLKAMCQLTGSTFFMGLLATVHAILYRYSNQEDIIIGSPIAGRAHSDLEDQIGFYVNTLALRTPFTGGDSFEKLLSSVRQITLDAYAHQDFPFDALVEELDLRRDLSRNALFDVLVVLQHQPDMLLEMAAAGLQIRSVEAVHELSKFDLQFSFTEEPDTTALRIIYNTDIYSQNMVMQLLDDYEQLLRAILAYPDNPVGALKYLDASTEAAIMGFNRTVPAPAALTVVAAFQQTVARHPDQLALVFGENRLTYRMLDGESDKLAVYLRETCRLQPGELVGVRLERSEWMIIALLGVLKAGAAFVPIDPAYPRERIDYIVSDSNCRIIIDSELLGQYFMVSESISGAPAEVTTPDHLAYVIYTSGSTGRPKGVMIRHAALYYYINAVGKAYNLGTQERVLQVSNFAFDAAVEQIMLSLFNGAALYVADQALATAADDLADYMAAHSITHLHGVPALLQHIDYSKITSLRRVVSAGEDCPDFLPKRVNSDTAFYNKYGPTEATISATLYRATGSSPQSKVPIGKPLRNSLVYILNDYDQPQPVGVAGEICIGGHSLAKGYLNQPELTAEKFAADPYQPGQLMYHTGDLGKWLPDGNIVFMGRKDDQVKIRGYRIEPGEIRNVLLAQDGITGAYVGTVMRNAEPSLAAYIVADETVDKRQLRKNLSGILPGYMVPAYIIEVDTIPLTPNGKINKKALLAISETVFAPASYTAPVTATEKRLVDIWKKILRLQKVGITDDFFEAGGNSLHITKMLYEINGVFDIRLQIKTVFAARTVQELAQIIDEEMIFKSGVTVSTAEQVINGENSALWEI